MNHFLQLAIESINLVEIDRQGDNQHPDLCKQLTNEAIAYALIAIAQRMHTPSPVFTPTCQACKRKRAFDESEENWRYLGAGRWLCPKCGPEHDREF